MNSSKKTVAAMLAAMAAMGAFAGLLDSAWLKGTTDKDPLTYRPQRGDDVHYHADGP